MPYTATLVRRISVNKSMGPSNNVGFALVGLGMVGAVVGLGLVYSLSSKVSRLVVTVRLLSLTHRYESFLQPSALYECIGLMWYPV